MALARSSEQPDLSNGRAPSTTRPCTPEVVVRPNAAQRGVMQQYQRAQVESASPTRLIVLLYDCAIRLCHIAREAMHARDLETQNTNLIRVQRIVGELLSSLDREAGGEVASNLSRIYAHLLEELVKANLYDKPEILDHVISVLSDMRASWVAIDTVASGDTRVEDAPLRDKHVTAAPAGAGGTGDSGTIRTLSKAARLMGTEKTTAESRLGDRLA